MTLKNQIVRIHRWFGLIMCLFFVAWFLSGFVMMYVDFPQYSKKERLAHQSPLLLDSLELPPSALSKLLSQDSSWKHIRIDMLLNRPVLRLENQQGERYAFYAGNGKPVGQLSAGTALAVAKEFMSFSSSALLLEKIEELDQWIPRKAFLIHMPIYRIRMDDPAETVLYISSKTGEILQVHTFSQRVLAWCGPIIHWVYPRELILRRALWRVVVILFSSLGIVASIAGIAAGLIRVKKKSGVYTSPYRHRWFRWHHYTGFIFGLFTFTWVFSGLLTMSPFGWSPEADITDQENRRLQQGNLVVKSFTEAPGGLFNAQTFSPVEIELKRFQGRSYYIAADGSGKTRMAIADTAVRGLPFRSFPQELFLRGIRSVHPLGSPAEISMLDQEDHYYYSKHKDKPLPVLRVKYADEDQTWYYADLSTGEIVLKNNASSRLSRWLYHGLHSLDFFNFQHSRPAWDIFVILLLSGGTLVSLTGLILSLRYFFKSKRS